MIFGDGVTLYSDEFGIKTLASFTNAGSMTFKGKATFSSLANQGTLKGTDFDGLISNSGFIDATTTDFRRIVNKIDGVVESRRDSTFKEEVSNSGSFDLSGGYISFKKTFTNYATGRLKIRGSTEMAVLNNEAGAKVELNGATLTAKNFNNSGILLFSMLNSALGQLVGNFVNQNGGKVEINVAGLTLGQKYQIINGTKIMLDEKDIEFIGGTGRYEGNGWIWIDNIFFNPENPLNSNQQIIKNALENLGISSNKLNQAVNDTDKTLQTSVIAQPKNMLNAFKADTLTSPLNSAYVSRLTASSETIMNDSSNFINPLERASQTQFFATPFGGVFKGDALNGHLFGLSVGLTYIDDEYIAQGHFAYAKGQSTQDLATQSTELNGDLFQVGGFARLFYGKVETDINANFIFGKFSLDNVWLNADMMNSSSNFNNYQVNLGGVVGWRFGEDLSVKPFVGVQGYYENQGEFQQDSGLGLTSKAYNSMVLDALAGVEGRYIFDNGSFIFAKTSYESKLYNSHKEVFMRTADESLKYENETYDGLISANLGARLLSTQHFKLDIEALYKHYDSGLNYFGGNLGVKWSF